MKTIRVIICAMIVFSSIACAAPQREVKILNLDTTQSQVLIYPSDLRGAYIPQKDAPLKFCAEPAPDVALDSLQKLAATLKASVPSGVSVDGGVSTEFSSKVVELAGRTQIVLIAREMLFRACELSLNYPTKEADALNLYKEVIALVKALGEAEKTQATANKTQAEANKTQAEANKAKEAAKLTEVLKKAGTTIDKVLGTVPNN